MKILAICFLPLVNLNIIVVMQKHQEIKTNCLLEIYKLQWGKKFLRFNFRSEILFLKFISDLKIFISDPNFRPENFKFFYPDMK